MIDALYDSFPTVIAVTLCVVFCLLCASFGSIAVGLRSICALCLTLAFTFGCAVLCYQDAGSVRNSLPVFLTTRTADPGISWLAPLLCFTIVVGLALDYDAPAGAGTQMPSDDLRGGGARRGYFRGRARSGRGASPRRSFYWRACTSTASTGGCETATRRWRRWAARASSSRPRA